MGGSNESKGEGAPALPAPLDRSACLGWLAALGAALAVYTVTMAPDLVWHDAGYYQWESARLNLVRPGEAVRVHPFFVVLAHGLGRVGVWNYAKAASVASMLGTAFLAANVWLIVYLLTAKIRPAVIAFLACMLSHTIWQQAVQPQTYGWSNAFLSGMIVCAIAYVRSRKVGWLLLMAFLGGVGLSVHLLSELGLAVLAVWVLVRVLRRRTPAWVLPAGIGLWVVGAGLFWYLVYLEYPYHGAVWPALESAVLGGWGGAVFNTRGIPRMLGRSLLMLVLNFPTPVAVLGLYGIRRSGRLLAGTSLAATLGVIFAVYLLFALRYRVPNQNFFFTPMYLLFAVYIGLGVHAAGWASRWRWFSLLVILTVAVVPMYRIMADVARARQVDLRGDGKMRKVPYRDFYTYYLQPWQHNQTGPRRFATEVLDRLPSNAVILADSTTSPPLKYLLHVEGRRPDVLLVDPYDAHFDESVRRYWRSKESLLPGLRAANRPVFVVSKHPAYVPKWVTEHARLEPFGLVFRVVPRETEGSG